MDHLRLKSNRLWNDHMIRIALFLCVRETISASDSFLEDLELCTAFTFDTNSANAFVFNRLPTNHALLFAGAQVVQDLGGTGVRLEATHARHPRGSASE